MIIENGRLSHVYEYDAIVLDEGAHIGDQAVNARAGLINIFLPRGITTIGNDALRGCTGLTTIILPSSVATIEDFAFDGCTGLTSITLPAGVTTIGNEAFLGCAQLELILIDSDDPTYIETLKAQFSDELKPKLISKREHIRQVRFEIAKGVLREGNVIHQFFSIKARNQEHSLADPNLFTEILDYC
jgi:hypothetical protein